MEGPIYGRGYYKITPLHAPWMALEVASDSSADATQVRIYDDIGGAAQGWRIISTNNGTFRLTPQCAAQSSLDVNEAGTRNFTKFQLWNTNRTYAQKFKFIPLQLVIVINK